MNTGQEFIYRTLKKAVQYAILYLEGELEYIKNNIDPNSDLSNLDKALLQTAKGYGQDLKDLRMWDNLDEILKGEE